MSRQHAVVEFDAGALRVRDLGSTNGIVIDGQRVSETRLSHGDRFQLGDHVFQLLVERKQVEPEAYEIVLDA